MKKSLPPLVSSLKQKNNIAPWKNLKKIPLGSWPVRFQIWKPQGFLSFFFPCWLLVVATGRFLEQFALRGFRGWHALGDLQVPWVPAGGFLWVPNREFSGQRSGDVYIRSHGKYEGFDRGCRISCPYVFRVFFWDSLKSEVGKPDNLYKHLWFLRWGCAWNVLLLHEIWRSLWVIWVTCFLWRRLMSFLDKLHGLERTPGSAVKARMTSESVPSMASDLGP